VAAAARRRSKKSAALAEIYSKDSRNNFVLSSTFSDDLSLVIDRKLPQNKYTPTKPSAERQQIIGGGAPINKSRRRPQIGGGGAVRPAHGSSPTSNLGGPSPAVPLVLLPWKDRRMIACIV